MPSPRYLRPIILPSGRRLLPIPPRLPYCPIIHQPHHGRTTATLRSLTKSQNFASLVGSAVAATFGVALWLRPQRPTNADANYMQKMERIIKPSLSKAF